MYEISSTEDNGLPDTYRIYINWLCYVEDNSEEQVFYLRAAFNNLIRLASFQQIGRKHFDVKRSLKFPQHSMDIWPGFLTKINLSKGGIFLNILN